MKEDLVANAAPRYRAFVSYSHTDARFAAWLHRKLEASRLPDGTRLAPIFIDRAELAAGPDLSAQVREALSESAALVVIASPAARASRWVGQEIELFRQFHPGRPVLAALIAGEPDEAFPDPLLLSNGAALEPLAADFREGQDGKRLGLLKLAAGLSAQPLDRLVQRDAQSRQRRVMAVTAGAVILSLVLSALLVVAIRARAEAERQRAEAEGLVEFMLTDLRDRLKGSAGPRIMAAVNQRALTYYANQNLDSLGDDSLDRRARVLHAMGEDDEKLGRYREAIAKYEEARRITQSVLSRRPNDPSAIFAHAQSEFWVGEAAWQQGDNIKAGRHWHSYHDQANALAKVEPGSARSMLELGYAEGNLCEWTAATNPDLTKALAHCNRSSEHIRAALTLRPDSAETKLALANRLGWQAELLHKLRRLNEALDMRNSEVVLIDSLLKQDPENLNYLERRQWPEIGIGRILMERGQQANAAKLFATCLARYDQLAAARPGDLTLTEQQLRVAVFAAVAAHAAQRLDASRFVQQATAHHTKLKRHYSSSQMERFDVIFATIFKEKVP